MAARRAAADRQRRRVGGARGRRAGHAAASTSCRPSPAWARRTGTRTRAAPSSASRATRTSAAHRPRRAGGRRLPDRRPAARRWPTDARRRARRRCGSTAAWRRTTGCASSWPTCSAVPVERPAVIETTALGAAYLAGLARRLLAPSLDALADAWRLERRFEPRMDAGDGASAAARVAGRGGAGADEGPGRAVTSAEATRRERIIETVRRQGFASIEALAQQLPSPRRPSAATSTRLCDQAVLHRHHGGAGLPSSVENLAYPTGRCCASRRSGGSPALVARHIPDDASLFINIGTTTEEVAKALLDHEGLRRHHQQPERGGAAGRQGRLSGIVAGGAGPAARPRHRRRGDGRPDPPVQGRLSASSGSAASTPTAHCSTSTIRRSGSPRRSSTAHARSIWRPTTASSAATPWSGWAPGAGRRAVHRRRAARPPSRELMRSPR